MGHLPLFATLFPRYLKGKGDLWFILKDMDPWIHGFAAEAVARAAAGGAAGAAASAATVCTLPCRYRGAQRDPTIIR